MKEIQTRVINRQHTEITGANVSHMVRQLIPRKLSKELFVEFLHRAKEWSDQFGHEIQWDLYLDKKTNEFVWDEPVQETTPTRVYPEMNYEMQTELFADENGKRVLRNQFLGSIHSHHVFQPFISEVDADSQAVFQLFGILGNFPKGKQLDDSFINKENLIFSTFYEGQHYIIPFEEVIDNA